MNFEITYYDIKIKFCPTTSWLSFASFVRDEAKKAFNLFIVDDEGTLDSKDLSDAAFDFIEAGLAEVYLVGMKASQYERAFDDSIIAAEEAELVSYRDTTITTARLTDDEAIGIMAIKDSVSEEMGELSTVLIGVFHRSHDGAEVRARELSAAIQRLILECESDEEE